MSTPAENLRRSFELTEAARREMAEQIATSHPEWSKREVELERNRRWLRRACEDEPCDLPTSVMYEMLCDREDRTEVSLDRAAGLVACEPKPFREYMMRLAQQLGVAEEWRSVLDRLADGP